MAAKRFLKSSVNWVEFAERVSPSERANFQKFKARVDLYMKRVMSYPENPPSIDWGMYRSRLSPALVDEFQKQYNNLKIPYPADTRSAEIDEQEKEFKKEIAAVSELSDIIVKVHMKQLDWWKSMMPFEEMSLEEFYEYFPFRYHPLKNPNFWPYDEPPSPIFPYRNKKIELD